MRKFKKFGTLLLAGVMILSFAACGQNNNTPAQSRSDQSGQRFSSGASSDTVRNWADSLNIGK